VSDARPTWSDPAIREAIAAAGFWPNEDVGSNEADPFIDWPSFWLRDHGAAEWLIEDRWARGRGHSVYALHKTGKSLLALHDAATLSQREDVLAVYLDYEMGEEDLFERLLDMGYDRESDLSRLRYWLLPTLPPLDTADGGRELARIIDAELALHPGCHPAVFIDTIARAVVGEENPADTIRAFHRFTGLELRRRQATWVRIDHAGWDGSRGSRGSSARGDDVDVIWRLEETEAGIQLVRVGARMGWVPEKAPLVKQVEPVLRFVATPSAWPAGTLDTAQALDDLGVPLDASKGDAGHALREAGKGRRWAVVLAALRWRRERAGMPGQEHPS
jgi:hypothetical protein